MTIRDDDTLVKQPAQQQEREARIAQLEAELMRLQGRELKLQFALAEQPKESPKFDPNGSFAREEAAVAKVREFMRNH